MEKKAGDLFSIARTRRAREISQALARSPRNRKSKAGRYQQGLLLTYSKRFNSVVGTVKMALALLTLVVGLVLGYRLSSSSGIGKRVQGMNVR